MKVDDKIIIVIVNYNSGEWLRKALKALSEQTLKPGKILVVDNNSSDNSLNCIQELYENIEIKNIEKNIGFASANNRAVAYYTKYEWIVLLNPDAIPENSWLENLIKAAENSEAKVGSFASLLLCEDNSQMIDGAGDILHSSGMAWRKLHREPYQLLDLDRTNIFSACGAAALYRREAWMAAGGFDDNFFCYYEDIDLGFRMRLLGYECRLVPDAVVKHVGSATSGKRSDFAVYHGHRNMVWTYLKNMPGILFWYYLPAHIIANLLAIVLYTRRGGGHLIVKSKIDALKDLNRVWKDRKLLNCNRKVSLNSIRNNMECGFLNLLLRYFKGLTDRSYE